MEPITTITFKVRTIENGLIVTINGKEIYFTDWATAIRYCFANVNNLGIDENDKVVTFEVNYPITQG